MLSRLSIRTKLVTLVSLLLVALTAMGLFAIIEMRAINASAQDIMTSWLPSVRLLGELRTQSARYRAVLRDYLTEPDEKFMADIQRNLDARAKDYDTANKAYEPLVSSPEEAGTETLSIGRPTEFSTNFHATSCPFTVRRATEERRAGNCNSRLRTADR